jgi:hypothetical protein
MFKVLNNAVVKLVGTPNKPEKACGKTNAEQNECGDS